MPKVSIIVPAYNVETYIQNTLIQIKKQTFIDFEVIIVNDGSTDKTSEICKRFLEEDKRFVLINKKNEGVSASRNLGLKIAKGEYITFIDSDDLVAEDYIEYLYNLITLDDDADIAMTIGKTTYDNTQIYNIPEKNQQIITEEQAVKLMLLRKKYRHANWGKLYKRNLWNDILFPADVIYDDYYTTYRVFANAKKVVIGDAVKYAYLQRHGSIMHEKCSIRTLSVIDVADNTTEFIISRWPNCKIEALDMKIATYMKNLQAIYNSRENNFSSYEQKIITEVKNNAKILIKSNNVPLKDKIKIMLLLFNKNFFKIIYNTLNK